ncbi:MAG: bacillithiol biosynthesis deacetylase BshB1 [Bacteroidales bacterium]
MTVDLLAFGPHPDDIEIGIGGTVALHAALGYRVGLCDLTVGELGSNGTPDERLAEGEEARRVLGAEWRENLRLPDGRLDPEPPAIQAIVEIVRRTRPRVVAAPIDRDRHPDHAAASRLVARGVFMAGLRRYEAAGDPWRPDWICYYFINDMGTPSFVVDVSACYDIKRLALACHRSQFAPTEPERVETRLTSTCFRQLIESRDAQFGASIGVAFAEGFVVTEPLVRQTLFKVDQGATTGAHPGAGAR